eukprot:Gb_30336 [translate_table: standard]
MGVAIRFIGWSNFNKSSHVSLEVTSLVSLRTIQKPFDSLVWLAPKDLDPGHYGHCSHHWSGLYLFFYYQETQNRVFPVMGMVGPDSPEFLVLPPRKHVVVFIFYVGKWGMANFSYLLYMVCPLFAKPPLPSHCSSYDVAMTALARTQPAGRYYESPIPYSITEATWFTGTTQNSHAYVTYSPYHGEDNTVILFIAIAQKNGRIRLSYWLIRPGSIHESLVQLSLGDMVKKCQGGCTVLKIIPSAANVATKLLIWKAPTKMGNSLIELLVGGVLILAKVEEKEMAQSFPSLQPSPVGRVSKGICIVSHHMASVIKRSLGRRRRAPTRFDDSSYKSLGKDLCPLHPWFSYLCAHRINTGQKVGRRSR